MGRFRVFHGSFEALLGITLWFFAVAILPEILIAMLVLRPVLARKMRRENVEAAQEGEYDEVFERIVAPVKEEIAALRANTEGDVSQDLEDFEARFTSAYQSDIQTLQTDIMTEMEKIPLRVSGIIHGAAGAEEKAFRAMVVDAEAEVEGEISMMDAVASQDPRAMQLMITQKIQKLGSDPEWQEKHQLGSLIMDLGKPSLIGWVQTMAAQMQGTLPAGMTPTLAAKSRTGKIYGT